MRFSAPASPASSAADDATLVARYVAGDDHAFAQLLARHQGPVFTTLVLLVHDRVLAEDLTQDTFLKVVKVLRTGRYQDDGKFGAWVCRIARNLAVDAHRRGQLRTMISLDAPIDMPKHNDPEVARPIRSTFVIDSTSPSPESLVIRAERNDQLRRLIEELPIEQRQVLLMRHYGDMSFQEISDAMGTKNNTTLGRMRRALVNLRLRMQPTAFGAGASLLVALLLAAGAAPTPLTRITRAETFTYSTPEPDSDDPNFYPGNADPIRIQRLV